MDSKFYILGNWKMAQSFEAAESFVRGIGGAVLSNAASRDVFAGIFPSYVHLSDLGKILPENLSLGAQDCSSEKSGAFTGEISAQMLSELNVSAVLVGHSERRQRFSESNEELRSKLQRAEEQKLLRVFCVGESKPERQEGRVFDVLKAQLEALQGLSTQNLLIAYEPVWAIGTGLVPSSEEIEEVHSWISRAWPRIPVLYGGSVKAENSKEILKIPGVRGLLIGGASLKKESFESILQCAIECVDS